MWGCLHDIQQLTPAKAAWRSMMQSSEESSFKNQTVLKAGPTWRGKQAGPSSRGLGDERTVYIFVNTLWLSPDGSTSQAAS